jgi:Tubulin domain
VQLNEYELHSKLMPFEDWHTGQELFKGLDKEFDLLDRDVRPFAEECDQLSGIQIFTSTDDAWGGFSSSYVDSLRDDFGKTSLWLWGLEDGAKVPRVSLILDEWDPD